MLIICEDCAKKYNIDESRIKGNRARFSCNECGHIIIVNKSDATRSLISSGSKPHASSTNGMSTIDLLKEMEGPIIADTKQDKTSEEASQPMRQKVKRKNRGTFIFVYFISSMLFALVCVSLATGYLYSEHLYTEYMLDVYPGMEDPRQDIMIMSALVFGGAWFVILAFFIVMARSMSKKVKYLILNANQLGRGECDITINKSGPREVRDLAFALERIRKRMKPDE